MTDKLRNTELLYGVAVPCEEKECDQRGYYRSDVDRWLCQEHYEDHIRDEFDDAYWSFLDELSDD